jgi:ABC-type multidrug transport system fused ATPase/permease subunit
MSTLPPPNPNQPIPPTPAAPGLSEGQRIINTFLAPSKTFEDIQKNSSWWVPFLISAVFTLIFAVVAVQKLDMDRFMQQQIEQSPSAQKRMEQVPPAQREQVMKFQATFAKVIFYLSPIFGLLIGVVTALILWVVFSFIFGGEIGFGRSMAVVFYAFLPGIISSIVLTISFLASSDPNNINISTNPMPTNPAFFMDPQNNRFLYGLLSGLDIFKIWIVFLLGLGFAKASTNKKPDTNTAVVTMFVIYAILVLCGAAWKAAMA